MTKELIIEHIKTPQQLGLAIKRFRKQKGMSQAQLADFMNMRPATVSDVENGKGTLKSLFKIVQVLQVNFIVASHSWPKAKGGKSKARGIVDILYK